MTTSLTGRQLLSTFSRHLGAFLLLFGCMWLAVHFLRLEPDLLYAAPAIYFVYLGATLFLGSRNRNRTRQEEI
ncbi:MAG: hypothetical protein ABWY27_20095 [Telluria sp.]